MKNIVICCDGTCSEYGERNTNVVRLYEAVAQDANQVAFYDPGVGTFSFLGREVGRRVGILLGAAFGAGLQQNVEDAYRYLMEHYEDGDKVFLFGFSRGAFTVRALAGMLHECGLLSKGSNNLVPYASKIYTQRDRKRNAAGFKRTYCRECKPHFIGVWDTVGSLGWVWGRKEFNIRLNGVVDYCYHAMALDESRRKFPVSRWDEERKAEGQTIEQVWFPGCHSDVGGRNGKPRQQTGIPDITLRWMLRKAQDKELRLKECWHEMLKSPDPAPVAVNDSRTGAWRLWRPKERPVPKGAKVHPSVYQLMEESGSGYRPRNLCPSGRYEVVET